MLIAGPVGGLADFTLSLADILFHLAFRFLRAVAGEFARSFLHRPFGLTLGAFYTVLIHDFLQLPAPAGQVTFLLAVHA